MTLKDQLVSDIRIFMNTDEFAEFHTFDDRTNGPRALKMIVETFSIDGKPLDYAEGVSAYNLVLHLDPIELGYIPQYGEQPLLDGVSYMIIGVENEFGMLKIVMRSNVG